MHTLLALNLPSVSKHRLMDIKIIVDETDRKCKLQLWKMKNVVRERSFYVNEWRVGQV